MYLDFLAGLIAGLTTVALVRIFRAESDSSCGAYLMVREEAQSILSITPFARPRSSLSCMKSNWKVWIQGLRPW